MLSVFEDMTSKDVLLKVALFLCSAGPGVLAGCTSRVIGGHSEWMRVVSELLTRGRSR